MTKGDILDSYLDWYDGPDCFSKEGQSFLKEKNINTVRKLLKSQEILPAWVVEQKTRFLNLLNRKNLLS